MSHVLDSEFGSIRSFFWPIRRHECRKVVPMLIMLFLICFTYSILRVIKDTVVITASGAEVIPFIKVWVLLPMAFLLTFIFTRLTSRYSQETVFYVMISGFLLFFSLFAFVVYPLGDALHPNEFAFRLEQVLPAGFKGLISMCCNWSLTLFYVIAELWGSIVLTVLFWGFANEITRLSEARRFYGVLTVAANVAAIAAGLVANYLAHSKLSTFIPFGNSEWEQILAMMVLIIVFCGLATMATFRWMNRNVLTEPEYPQLHIVYQKNKPKKKLSLRESFYFLARSKYLICIAVIVVSYNLVINLVEVIWKAQLKTQYPLPADYNNFMNVLTAWMGVFSTCTSFFMARMIGRFGWTPVALITPFLMLVTSAGFFTSLFFQDAIAGMVFSLVGATPLMLAVFFGAAQNCLSKAAKYSVFDATKEMSFIPVSSEYRLKGKAAIDGIGSRLGKSGGSLVHQVLLVFMGSLAASAPLIAVILTAVIGIWVYCTKSLGIQFDALIASDSDPIGSEKMEDEPLTGEHRHPALVN